VGVAQLAEHRTVAPVVAGSIPVSHPKSLRPCLLPIRSRPTADQVSVKFQSHSNIGRHFIPFFMEFYR
jgi:hypothetical protein